jgi:hypothetical protein
MVMYELQKSQLKGMANSGYNIKGEGESNFYGNAFQVHFRHSPFFNTLHHNDRHYYQLDRRGHMYYRLTLRL